MQRYTIAERLEGRYRLHINHGGQPFWCMFDYVISPDSQSGDAEIHLATGADSETIVWFAHLRRGMLAGLERASIYGQQWVGVRIEVRKVFSHPIDTTAQACEYYGLRFVHEELSRHGLRLSDEVLRDDA